MTSPISLVQCAVHYGNLSHQNKALEWLQTQITSSQLWSFARAYRNNEDGSTINLKSVMRYFSNLPHQIKALEDLEKSLGEKILKDFAKQWRSSPPQSQEILLDVTWDSQINSRFPDQAYRMCFSSSVWMVASYSSPGFKKKFPKDDDYLNFMLDYGDTTNSTAHLQALRDLGLKPVYAQDLNCDEAIKLLKQNKPLAIGILHHGSHKYPEGTGHWCVIRGINESQDTFYINDPYGSVMDNPPYSGAVENGCCAEYPRWMMNYRWTVDSPGKDGKDGWGLYFE